MLVIRPKPASSYWFYLVRGLEHPDTALWMRNDSKRDIRAGGDSTVADSIHRRLTRTGMRHSQHPAQALGPFFRLRLIRASATTLPGKPVDGVEAADLEWSFETELLTPVDNRCRRLPPLTADIGGWYSVASGEVPTSNRAKLS